MLAAGAYVGKGVGEALEMERNLQGYLNTADGLNAFVEHHRRWPRDETELRDFPGQPADWSERRDEALSRSVVSYDFDLSRENLDAPETFRGLRQKEPAFRSGHTGVKILLATLREIRDAQATPGPVRQAVPGDAEVTSAGDESGSREGASESDAAPK